MEKVEIFLKLYLCEIVEKVGHVSTDAWSLRTRFTIPWKCEGDKIVRWNLSLQSPTESTAHLLSTLIGRLGSAKLQFNSCKLNNHSINQSINQFDYSKYCKLTNGAITGSASSSNCSASQINFTRINFR
jgi:hypothetical protein